MTFGEKLQKLRKEKSWSQEELAIKITVSRQAVSKWELDEVTPDTENIIQLSEVFNVSTDFLLKDSYDVEKDISIVKDVQANTLKEANIKRPFKLGCALLITGILIVGILITLSQIVTSRVKVERHTPAGGILYQLPNGTTKLSDEAQTSYSYMDTKSFLPFLNTYYLHWVLILGCVFIIAGIVNLVRYGRYKKRLV